MITCIVFASLLMQDPRPLPDHVQLVFKDRAQQLLAERLRGQWKKLAPSLAVAAVKPDGGVCSTMVVIPVDPDVDPKIAIQPKDQPAMPSFTGNEPCYNKLP